MARRRKKGTISLIDRVRELLQSEGIAVTPLHNKQELAEKILFSSHSLETYSEERVEDRRYLLYHPEGSLSTQEVRNLMLVYVGWGDPKKKPLAALRVARKIVKKKLIAAGVTFRGGDSHNMDFAEMISSLKGLKYCTDLRYHEVVLKYAKEGDLKTWMRAYWERVGVTTG